MKDKMVAMIAVLTLAINGSSALGDVQFFTDLNAWIGERGTYVAFPLNAENLAKCDPLTEPPTEGPIPSPLTCRSVNSGFLADLTIRAVNYPQFHYDPAFCLLNEPVIDIGSPPGPSCTHDDWEVTFPAVPTYAFAFTIRDVEGPAYLVGESVCVHGPNDVELGCFEDLPDPNPPCGEVFVGVISSEPITRVSYDEANEPEGDNNALAVLYFSELDCNDNGVPDELDMAECDGSPWCSDCNGNDVLDECDIAVGDLHDYFPPLGIADECGACCIAEDCLQASQTVCDASGRYLGDNTECGVGPGDCSAPIPAVSEWGLVVMTLLGMVVGTLVFMRGRRSAEQSA